MKRKTLISACLLGIRCRYDGISKPCRKIIGLIKSKKIQVIPICPEQLGGMNTPRHRSGIFLNYDGYDVLKGKAKVINEKGEDVSINFIKGAKESLEIARITGSNKFIGKSRSPSCGLGIIHKAKLSRQGRFIGYKDKGDGVTTALFKKNHIEVITDEMLS